MTEAETDIGCHADDVSSDRKQFTNGKCQIHSCK
jgi:hypothetical protein